MAAGVTIKIKRKAGAFTTGQLAAGELGLNTTTNTLYWSPNGTAVVALSDEITLTDGATVSIDPTLGHRFYLATPGGAGRSLDMTGAGYPGQIILIAWKNTHGSTAITHTLVTAGLNDFRYPNGYNALSSTPTSGTQRIVCQYHAADAKWDILDYTGGSFNFTTDYNYLAAIGGYV